MTKEKAHLIKVEAQLSKAYRSAFGCGVLVIAAMMLSVMVPMLAGHQVDQKSVAESWAPFIIFIAAIAGVLQFFHFGVKSKLRKLEL
ncbi:hypothetical protein [Pseudomonas cannabina]|uniref:hypothetical protein n=1 Tax=Pseudomonas cannabina TaxID=86840 RepID=UPI000F004F7F|nr:hypothetical protein [Pseudomonas cannabina]